MDPFTIVAEVLEGISSTVDGGIYNIVSHTELNPLALDSTAKALLESKAGTELQAIVNDAGQTIGYMAKGAAQAGNGAAADVSTYINVVAQEVEVTSEMAAETYIEATTGEVAQLTVGETVETLSASSTGAGILAMDVGVAGAAIAPALGVLAGVGLYNIAPEFWDSVGETLVSAGQTVGGKVQAIFDSDGKTSFSQDTIEIYKDAFLRSNYFKPQPVAQSAITENATITGFCAGTITPTQYANNIDKIVTSNAFYTAAGFYCTDAYIIDNNTGTTYNMPSFAIGKGGNRNEVIYLAVKELSLDYSHSLDYKILDANGSYILQGGITSSNRLFYNGHEYVGLYNFDFDNPYYENLPLTSFSENDLKTFLAIVGLLATLVYPNTQPNAVLPSDNPFPSDYPSWLPSTNIGNTNYYPVGLPTDDTTQPDSQTGDNDDPEKKDKLVNIIYITPEPDPTPTPQPDPDPQPDPEPEPEQEVIPQDDPIDPNPDPDPSDPTPPLPVVETTSASSMFCIYNPTDTQVNSLGAFLWTSNIIEQIKQMWSEPLNCIIAFHKVYAQPSTGGSKNIKLGYIDSGVSALEVTQQFTEINCGSINVNEKLHNATDYTPFTKAHIYLPFIGIVELDITDIMAGTINVKYKVDVYTGTCIAMIFCQRSKDMASAQMLYSFSGNAAQQLPLTGANFQGAINGLLGLAGAGVAVATGGGIGLAAGAVSAAHSLTQEMIHVQRSGGLSANAGIMAPRKPYLILSRQSGYDANGYNAFYGYPANKSMYLSNVSGYVRIKNINLRTGATAAENDLILAALHDGVII